VFSDYILLTITTRNEKYKVLLKASIYKRNKETISSTNRSQSTTAINPRVEEPAPHARRFCHPSELPMKFLVLGALKVSGPLWSVSFLSSSSLLLSFSMNAL